MVAFVQGSETQHVVMVRGVHTLDGVKRVREEEQEQEQQPEQQREERQDEERRPTSAERWSSRARECEQLCRNSGERPTGAP